MTRVFRLRLAAIAVFLALVGLCAAGIWRYAHVQALGQIEKQGRADLTLATDRLTGELRRFRELAVLLADHPTIDQGARQIRPVLRDAADKSGALGFAYADDQGTILVDTGWWHANVSGTAFFRRAMQGALGRFHGRLGPDGPRVFMYAAPSFSDNGGVRGAMIVAIDIGEVEWDWIGGQPALFFTSENGGVFLSNRSEILGWQKRGDSLPLSPADGPAPDFARRQVAGFDLWRMDWGDYLPARALHLQSGVPVVGLQAHALIDTSPARRIAWLQTSVFAMVCLIFGVGLLWLSDRRRRLALANSELERRVKTRTSELSATNTALRREVQERQEAEAALKQAQADLVQAGKLSALGQMSAGISHELNQPLTAIRQFADNAGAFLEAGQDGRAAENLSRIGQLAARAGRIIQNLRAFARNESEPMGKVNLVQVIDSAVELTETRLRSDGIKLDWARPDGAVYVLGGEVRLGQVFVNLITNAADAMADSPEKRIRIMLQTGPRPCVTLCDTGPGIADPDKMFEPFYSTKAVGSGEGMGLGLSISYGLVQSFGGQIKGSNLDRGGAMMTVELEPWMQEAAA